MKAFVDSFVSLVCEKYKNFPLEMNLFLISELKKFLTTLKPCNIPDKMAALKNGITASIIRFASKEFLDIKIVQTRPLEKK